MSTRIATIDCRGLPTAIALLRIKQALLNLSSQAGPVLARLNRGAASDKIAAGLREQASRVRFVSGDATTSVAKGKARNFAAA